MTTQAPQEQLQKEHEVEVEVDYLPATEDFKMRFSPLVVLETIRTDAMSYFGVQDRTVGRDTYVYYLAHDGTRIQNTQITLEQVIGEHAHHADFSLVEEITTGGTM